MFKKLHGKNLYTFFAVSLAVCATLVLIIGGAIIHAQTKTQFFYTVNSIDANGIESANSNEVSVTAAQIGAGAKHTVHLTWDAVTTSTTGVAVAGFTVKRGVTAGGPYVVIGTSSSSILQYDDIFTPPAAPVVHPVTVN